MSRNAIAVVSSILFVAFAAMLIFVPVPYVTWRPGQTVDVLGSTDQGQLVEVVGYPETERDGQLLMTTVSTSRVDSSVSLPEAILVHLAQDSDAMPRDVIYPPGRTAEQVRQEGVAMMDRSREHAAVAALRAAGEAVDEVPMVAAVSNTGPAADLLQPGDLIRSVDAREVNSQDDVAEAIRDRSVGDTIVFRVIRSGQEETISVISAAGTDAQPVVGINVGTGYLYSPQVVYRIDSSVVGPSAGLILSLAVYDRLTDANLFGEARIAGSGTIDSLGKVGSVGGIREKIKGAERDGATVFLLPEANCEALGDLESDVRIVPVPSLTEAISVLQLLRTDPETPGVPHCE